MRKMYSCVGFFLLLFAALPAFAYDLVVAKDGSGNYTSVQAAINAAPTNAVSAYTIYIKNGEYFEKINIPSNKPFITIIGESTEGVILTYNDYASRVLEGGGTVGTLNSASFTVNATDFTAINITFVNSYGDGSQAVAIAISNDRAVFKNCRFLGNQDTLYLRGSGTPRQYFNNCYIDGNVDYIFGNAIAVFDSCAVYSKNRVGTSNSYLTAANTPPGQAYGFVFRNCLLTDHSGTTLYYLGRPWQNSTGSSPIANNKTVFLNSRMGAKIRPEGWSTWDAGTQTDLITYAEYNSRCYNGDLVSTAQRVAWSKQLTISEANDYTLANIFGSWDPCTTYAGICDNMPFRPYVNNFKGTKGSPNSSFTWNLAWPKSGVQFELFRATAPAGPFVSAGTVSSPNDSLVDFSITDPNPPSGSIYYYYVRASFTGVTTIQSDTVQISSAPTIVATSSMPAFYQNIGSPSPTSNYTVSGTDLTGDVTITPPANFEISGDNGTTWNTNAAPLLLSPASGTLASKNILVRLNATVAGDYAASIMHASSGAVNVEVNVSGKAVDAPTKLSNVLLKFPLNANASDNPADRAAGVKAATVGSPRLFVSNGTTVPSIPAFSDTYGMAFGATSNGDGSWGTAVGGPGGNLNRSIYEEITVEGDAKELRLDSLVLYSAFYNTNSNTRLGIVYSLSQFVLDSANVTGGTGPTGGAVVGSFGTPITLNNQNTGPNQTFRVALNAENGVQVPAGGKLTIRFYFSCGSTSTGRYGLMKNLEVKGEVLDVLPLTLLSFTGKMNAGNTMLEWNTSNEQNMRHFEVEHSADASLFSRAGVVNARNLSAAQIYSFTHQPEQKGWNYYRLKMVNTDGTFRFSKTVALSVSGENMVTVFPNPAHDNLQIKSAIPVKNLRIVDVSGRIMLQQSFGQGQKNINLELKNVPAGNYILIGATDGEPLMYRFIKTGKR